MNPVQDGYTITPLSQLGKAPQPVKVTIDPTKFRVKTLDKDSNEKPEGGMATIMADEFFNVYETGHVRLQTVIANSFVNHAGRLIERHAWLTAEKRGRRQKNK